MAASTSRGTSHIKVGTKHERYLVCPECLQAYTPEMRDYFRQILESGGNQELFFQSVASDPGYLPSTYWTGKESIRGKDLKDCCKDAFRKDPDLSTMHPRYGTHSFSDPSITYMGMVGCSGCNNRKISMWVEEFEQKVAREGMDPEVFFNQRRIKQCCRKFVMAPMLIPLGKTFYNEKAISGTPVDSVASSSGKHYYDTVSKVVSEMSQESGEPAVVDIVARQGSSRGRAATAQVMSNILEGGTVQGVGTSSFFRNVSNPISKPEVAATRKIIFARDFNLESIPKVEQGKTDEERANELFMQQFPSGSVSADSFAPIQIQGPTPSFMSSTPEVPQKTFSWMASQPTTSVQSSPMQTTQNNSATPWLSHTGQVTSSSSWTSQSQSSQSTGLWEKYSAQPAPTSGPSSSSSSSSSSTTIPLPIIDLKGPKEEIQIPESLRVPDRNDPNLQQKIRDFLRSSKKREPTEAEVQSSLTEYIDRAIKKRQAYIEQRVKGNGNSQLTLAFPGVYKVKPTEFQRDEAGNISYYEANPDYIPGSKSTPSYRVPKLQGFYQAR